MSDGIITFGATHTPNWDQFKTVTLSVTLIQTGGHGGLTIHTDVSVEKAREYAAQIERACQIVEADQ